MTENAGEVTVASLRGDAGEKEVRSFFAMIQALRIVGKAVALKYERSDYYQFVHLLSLKEEPK